MPQRGTPRSHFQVPQWNTTFTSSGRVKEEMKQLSKTWKLLEPSAGRVPFWCSENMEPGKKPCCCQSWGCRARAEPSTPGLIMHRTLLQMRCGLTADAHTSRPATMVFLPIPQAWWPKSRENLSLNRSLYFHLQYQKSKSRETLCWAKLYFCKSITKSKFKPSSVRKPKGNSL